MRRKVVSLMAVFALVGAGLAGGTAAQAAPAASGPGSLPAAAPAGARLVTPKTPPATPAQKVKGSPVGKRASLVACPSAPAAACYKYAGTGMNLSDPSDGIGATVTVSKPFVKPNDHSLVELAARNASDSVVEVGWNVDPILYGDSNPHLFAFWWKDGVAQGYNQGGGLQNVAGCSPCAGASLLTSVGTNKQFGVQYFTNAACGCTEGWWLSYNGNYFGAYPATLWTGAAFATASRVDGFVEVASLDYDDTCSDGGSGAIGGAAASTIIGNLDLPGSTDSEDFDASGNLYRTVAAAWQVTGITDIQVRPGGPGYNSIGGTPGATGSCAPSSPGTPAASSAQLWAEFCPDGQATTGCNGTLGTYTTATAPLNTCVPLTIAQYKLSVLQNNAGVSMRSYRLWATSGCTGGTSLNIPNAGSGNPAFEPHAIQRNGA